MGQNIKILKKGGLFIFNLSLQDVLFGMLLAFFLTCLVLNIIKLYELLNPKYKISQKSFNKIISRCNILFSQDKINFKGNT